MAISRCNKCGKISEHERELVGTTFDCQCGTNTTIYDTRYFVSKLSEMYFALRKEFKALDSSSETSNQTQLEKNGERITSRTGRDSPSTNDSTITVSVPFYTITHGF